MGAPTKAGRLKDSESIMFQRIINPDDPTEVVQIQYKDTGLLAADGTKIYAMAVVAGGSGTSPQLPAALIVNPPITLAGGVPEQLPAKALVSGINMKADSGNDIGGIWIGADNTVAANNGYPLYPGSGIPIEIQDMDKIWVFGTAGDILYYLGG